MTRCMITTFLFAALTSAVSASDTTIDVLPLSPNCDWEVAPDGSGIVVTSTDGNVADFLVGITTADGFTTAAVSVSNDGSLIEQQGDAGYSLAAPLVIQREEQIAFALACSLDTTGSSATSSAPSRSWLDDYANWFNNTFGSGWSEAAGGVIHDGLTLVMEEETLANTSDGALLTGTVIVSVPAAVGIVYGGEVLLGVGTFGGSASAAAGGGALLGAEAEIAAAHAEIAAIEADIAFLETGIAEGIGTIEQVETAQAAIAILRTRIADLWAYIDFMLSLL